MIGRGFITTVAWIVLATGFVSMVTDLTGLTGDAFLRAAHALMSMGGILLAMYVTGEAAE